MLFPMKREEEVSLIVVYPDYQRVVIYGACEKSSEYSGVWGSSSVSWRVLNARVKQFVY